MNPSDGNPRTWTTDTLLEHLRLMMDANDQRYEQRFALMDMALTKAEQASEKRFASVNEFRQQLGDQARTFMPRAEYELAHKALMDKIEASYVQFTDCRSAHLGSAAGGKNILAWIMGGFGLLMFVINILLLIFEKLKP